MMNQRTVRVRFAPSPTGYLHVGGARTALFNWLFARHHSGTFVLRVDDTDQTRNIEEGISAIYAGLMWLGLDWDEGPCVGGDFGPYFQSQRKEIYERYLNELEKTGVLYEDQGAIRFRSKRQEVTVNDLICGKVTFDRKAEPDMTLRRADGSFIYHFTTVVDELEMQISHVIRGEDHLTNTAKHIELFEALGAEPPDFAHIPLILNTNSTKMSKRDEGASIYTYMEKGYAPEAVLNYLCLLGWSPKDDREILNIDEVIQLFKLESVNRRNAHFDIDKCYWINGKYIASMPLQRFCVLSQHFLDAAEIEYEEGDYLNAVLEIVKEKIKFFSDLPEWTSYFFTENYPYDESAVKQRIEVEGALERLEALGTALKRLEHWSSGILQKTFEEQAEFMGCHIGQLIHPTRVAVSGKTVGPSLYHMLEVMGKERTLSRIRRAVETFGTASQ